MYVLVVCLYVGLYIVKMHNSQCCLQLTIISILSYSLSLSHQPLAHVTMYLFTKTPKQGAQTTIHCAVAREVEGVSGKYWDDSAIKAPSRAARDDDACANLWEYSVRLVGLAGDKED